jgi:hypothetical protein
MRWECLLCQTYLPWCAASPQALKWCSKESWTRTSKTVSQKWTLSLSWFSQVFLTVMESWLTQRTLGIYSFSPCTSNAVVNILKHTSSFQGGWVPLEQRLWQAGKWNCWLWNDQLFEC